MERQELDRKLREADRLYAQGRLEEALKAYRDVLAEDEAIAWAHSRVGAILAQMNDLDGAERALTRAIELDPKLPQAHSNLGNVFYSRGDYHNALAKYKEAVALDPNNPTFHENLHAAYKKLGRLSEAVAALKQAHRLDRALAREEARATITAVKENLSRGRGCRGAAVTLLVSLVALLLIVVLW